MQHGDPTPTCPIDPAHGPMVVRTARKGPNAGGQFFGCSKYPKCKAIVNLDPDSDNPAASPTPSDGDSDRPASPPSSTVVPPCRVPWRDGTLKHPEWRIHHATQGASLRSVTIPGLTATKTCWVACENRPGYERVDADVDRVIGLMMKLLQRGSTPPIHPDAERSLLEELGHGDVLSSELPGDISPVLQTPVDIDDSTICLTSTKPFPLRDLTESPREAQFVDWLGERAPAAVPWLIPQASFDLLLEAAGLDGPGCRRCDFLVALPGHTPFVIEIDGSQHNAQVLTDEERDQRLCAAEIPTVRVPTTELDSGTGPNLTDVLNRISNWDPTTSLEPCVWAPIQLHRLVLAICEAVRAGFLSGSDWCVRVDDPTGLAIPLVAPYLQLFDALFRLWNLPDISPTTVTFTDGDRWVTYTRDDDGHYSPEVSSDQQINVRLRMECDHSPFESLPALEEIPSIVVRSTGLHLAISDSLIGGPNRVNLTENNGTRSALRAVLRAVFAKNDFREGQYEAVVELLEGRDVTILLPTGAGKSLIYQLAGLCLPGRTIVIDPVIALIQDQQSGLGRYGIDRAVGLSSRTTQQGLNPHLLDLIGKGDAYFFYVAPERCQMQDFRDTIAKLRNITPINLAVIDEAHYVSEWGHSFRTSYLMLGPVLRRECKTPEGDPPPVVAMTGTASKPVLNDVLYQLQMKRHNDNSVIVPKTFDRPELRFNLRRTPVANDEATLAGVLTALPADFGGNPATFFVPDGTSRTYSGLVFVPTVNGYHRLLETRDLVEPITGEVGLYSGGAPRGWDRNYFNIQKDVWAARFKDNTLIGLVVTNAFGVGIDKPNIRWVAHYGLPSSMEAYYQEVGRAGRDGGRSECYLVLSQFDAERNRDLLALDIDVDKIKTDFEWAERDDVTTALFLHTLSFKGVGVEVDQVKQVVEEISPGPMASHIEIPFGESDPDQELKERAVHRLVTLGVINDYLKDYGGRKFTIRLAGVTPGRIVDHLLDYVERIQPSRLDAVREVVGGGYPSVEEALEGCTRQLVTFVYETIERSRRRSLREMWLAASECRNGEELRQRILDYLTEGDLGQILQGLVDEAIAFDDWVPHWRNLQAVAEIAEWRVAAGRLLVAYPDHPGLLVTRGLVEALDPVEVLDPTIRLREFELNVVDGIKKAIDDNVPPDRVERVLDGIKTTLEQNTAYDNAIPILIGAMKASDIESATLDQYLEQHWKDTPELMVLYLADEMDRTVDYAGSLLG